MSATDVQGPRRQLSAILFADVHGYTRLMSRAEEQTYERVTRSIRLIRSLIGDYGGGVVQTSGDGVLALFESAGQALKFAVAIQREFRNDAVWNADDEPIAFRIGINLGEVIVGDDSVHGHSVNVAARIQALARPGGICISEGVRQAVQDTLGVRIQALGVRSLKNIAEPIEVFAIEINGAQRPELHEQLRTLQHFPQEQTDASVAVLPLRNLSGDARDDHLCDGITGDIIANLSRFRDLLIIARHSAFLFKNHELPLERVGRHLGVRYVLNGGLQRSGSKIRINVELAEAASGRIIWSDRYGGDLGDVFAFQDDVTGMIAARLAIQVNAAEARRISESSPPDLRAYGLILRGQELSLHFRREATLYARRLFEEAADIQPTYGRSYAGMSRTYNLSWRYAWTDSRQAALEKAVELAQAAIDYDRLDARGYGELGFAQLYKKQHDQSLAAYDRAIELNPNDADILAEMGDALSYSGDHQRAIQLLHRAMRLNPYYPDWYLWYLGEAHFHLGDFEQTIETLKKMRNQSEAHRLLAASYAHLGQMAEAGRHAQQVLAVHPKFSIDHWRTVPPYRDPEHLEVLIEGLRRAGLR